MLRYLLVFKKVLTYLIYKSKINYNIDLLGEAMKYENKITTIKVILNEDHYFSKDEEDFYSLPEKYLFYKE